MNGFDNEGAFAVADIIKRNTTLLNLDVSYNRIGTPGAQVIAKALETNDSLKILKVSVCVGNFFRHNRQCLMVPTCFTS